jgi:hypothetical protein
MNVTNQSNMPELAVGLGLAMGHLTGVLDKSNLFDADYRADRAKRETQTEEQIEIQTEARNKANRPLP